MTRLDEILNLEDQSKQLNNEAQTRLAQLREDIKSGTDSTKDPITDFCIVHHGRPDAALYQKIQGITASIQKGGEFLLRTVVNGAIETHTCHFTYGTTERDAYAIEYLRLGVADDVPVVTIDGITIPVKHYAWNSREGAAYDGRIGLANFHPWEVSQGMIVVKPEELIAHYLHRYSDLPVPHKKKLGYRQDFVPLGIDVQSFGGQELQERFKELGFYYREEFSIKREEFYEDGKKVLELGMSLKEFDELQKRIVAERKDAIVDRIVKGEVDEDLIREAISLDLHKERREVKEGPGKLLIIPEVVSEYCRTYRIDT
jgi:hypothetical protein